MSTRLAGTWTTVWRWFREIPRAYAQIFFARSAAVGLLFALATATEPRVLAFGLVAVVSASLVARGLGLDHELRASGYFGYNALLLGLGLGHGYAGSWMAMPMVLLAAGLAVLVTSALKAWLTRSFALPVLSLPFLAVFALVTWAAPSVGLAPTLAPVGDPLPAGILPALLAGYLRCLGSIFFLPTVAAGAWMALALLVHSRIAMILSFAAFALVSATNTVLPSPLPEPEVATAAANALLLSVALGGVWFIPSLWSAAWAGAGSLACLVITAGLAQPLSALGLPALFIPFNLVAFLFLLAARERVRDRRPQSVDFLPGSPEENLRYHLNQRARFPLSHALRIHLPFRGRWTCTQGVDGPHTHQGRWRHGFDFEVLDANGRRFHGDPTELSNYHCYKLPVLAVAPGTVISLESDIPDNPVGEMNLRQNWGNYVIVQHGPALYSLVAHLAPRSIKVRPGQVVAQGEVLGLCGNSGRSPTPHIHFHLQSAPFLGADTVAATFNDVVAVAQIGERLEAALVPREGDVSRNLEPGGDLPARISARPGDEWRLRFKGTTETVRLGLDLFGQTCWQSDLPGTSLTATHAGDFLAFHDVVGTHRSVLALVRAALPRLPLEDNAALIWRDFVPARIPRGLSRFPGWWTAILPSPGWEMTYLMHQEGAQFIIVGTSLRTDRRHRPRLRTRIVFDGDQGPVSIQLSWKGRSVGAHRPPRAPVERIATVLPLPKSIQPPKPLSDLPHGQPDRFTASPSSVRKESP